MSSGPSGKHRPVTGDELLEQRQQLVELAIRHALPYRLHADEPPPLGALAALARALGRARTRDAADWWRGRRKFKEIP